MDEDLQLWTDSVLDSQRSEKYEFTFKAEELVARLEKQGLSRYAIVDALKMAFDLPGREAEILFVLSKEITHDVAVAMRNSSYITEDRPFGDRHGGMSVIDPEPQRDTLTNVSRTSLPADREPPQAFLQTDSGRYKAIVEGSRIPKDFVGFLAYESVLYRISGGRVESPIDGMLMTPGEGQQVRIFKMENGELIFSPSTMIRELQPGDVVDIPDGQSVRRLVREDEFEFASRGGEIMAARVIGGEPGQTMPLDQLGFGRLVIAAKPDGTGIQVTARTAVSFARIDLATRTRGRTVYDMVASPQEWLADKAAERAAAAGSGAENAAQDSTVTGIVDNTGETSGGAFASGAAHLYPAAQHARSRQAQRTTGYTQLAGAQRAIRAGYAVTNAALPAARPIVTKF